MEIYQGSKKQFYNCIKIDELLRNKTYPSVKRLMDELEVSERQVLRIIKDMKEIYNAPIEYDREHKGYCYLLDGFSISDISLDENESFALQVCNSFAVKVFGGSDLFRRLYKGLSLLQHRAELFDNDEGKALADRIHFAIGTTNMGFDLLQKQNDFENLLFDSIKRGQILKVTKRCWETRELQQEIVLPIMVVMHENYSWLLFFLKFSAFSQDLKSINLNINNFGVIPFNDITAINTYKDEHAKKIYIKNNFNFPGNTTADSTSEPTNVGSYERKGIRMIFTIEFPELDDCEPYNVSIHFEVNDSFEYKVKEEFLDGAYHIGEDPLSNVEPVNNMEFGDLLI